MSRSRAKKRIKRDWNERFRGATRRKGGDEGKRIILVDGSAWTALHAVQDGGGEGGAHARARADGVGAACSARQQAEEEQQREMAEARAKKKKEKPALVLHAVAGIEKNTNVVKGRRGRARANVSQVTVAGQAGLWRRSSIGSGRLWRLESTGGRD